MSEPIYCTTGDMSGMTQTQIAGPMDVDEQDLEALQAIVDLGRQRRYTNLSIAQLDRLAQKGLIRVLCHPTELGFKVIEVRDR